MTTDPNQDRQIHTGEETDMILRIEEIGMTAIQAGRIIVIILSYLHLNDWRLSYF